MSFDLSETTDKPYIIKDDEIFLKNVLKDFYQRIIETNDFNNFENISSEWIKYELESNDKNPKKILEVMKNHEKSKFWFTSFMGFFYQLGIGCDIDRKQAPELYMLAINNNEVEEDLLNENFNKLHLIEEIDDDTFDSLRDKNTIIGKYLLSLFYYKDIIIDIEGFNYGRKETEDNDRNELINLLKLAKNDDSEAQYKLAICYMDGIGIQKNAKKACSWFLKSEQNNYQNSRKMDKDEKKEFERNLKLAVTNNSMAQNYLGNCYWNGKGINKSKKRAFEWYLKSAIAGCAKGQSNLGYCYYFGIGTDKNETKAFEWYLKSAVAGCAKGQCNLGYCYKNGIGTEMDKTKAFEWYVKSAENGNAIAQNRLGDCYRDGIEMDKNTTKAFEWYWKSAVAGSAEGQCNVGYCYEKGIGIEINKTKAFDWYLKSAENGNAIAQNNLGYYYGINKNERLAFEWYRISAENGNAMAQINLGYCYKNGIGTSRDDTKAFQWYVKSAVKENNNIIYENGIGTDDKESNII